MSEFVISGGNPLRGEITVGGAKNVVLPALAACLLTDEEVRLENVPLISDLTLMIKIIKELGVDARLNSDHSLVIRAANLKNHKIPLETAAKLRASFMLIVPLLVRLGRAAIPNPGGCRIGARPIGRPIKGLENLGAKISYNSDDGYFYARQEKFLGRDFEFDKNTHTGTEMLILAAVLAKGQTVLKNAAQEPEIDDLIKLLNQMGADIKRARPREIVVNGVTKLSGTSFKIMGDRNEVVTFAIAALVTKGDIVVGGAQKDNLEAFLTKLSEAGAGWKEENSGIRFFYKNSLNSVNVETAPYPGFMTDWQAPWVLLMTHAKGQSEVHETVYEDRFQYISELVKMGAKISLFNPKVSNPEKIYNFDLSDDKDDLFHAAKITGPTVLHNAILEIPDLRAGATLVLAALAAKDKSYLSGVEHIDRGYERFAERLIKLGAKIRRKK